MTHAPLYLVTGGAGFIGSHIAATLLNRRCRVRVFDNLSSGLTSNIKFLRSLGSGKLEVVRGDLRDHRTVKKVVSGSTYVLHQAALPSVLRSVKDPQTTHEVNVNGTLNLLLASRDLGVRRFVFASSSSIYGDSRKLPKVETQVPKPLSPYAASKLTGELYCALFNELYGLRTIMLRYFNIYGPRQDPASEYAAVIPAFLTAIRTRRPPVIFGDGQQSRDFTFVTDAVQANVKACHAKVEACGKAYNVAGGKRVSLLQLIRELASQTKCVITPRFRPARPGDVRHSQARLERAQKGLGYRPQVTLRDGLHHTIEAF